MEMQLHCFCVIPTITRTIEHIKIPGRELSFDTVNLCKSNVVQPF